MLLFCFLLHSSGAWQNGLTNGFINLFFGRSTVCFLIKFWLQIWSNIAEQNRWIFYIIRSSRLHQICPVLDQFVQTFFRLRIWRSVVRFLDSAWCSYLTNNMPAVERFPLSFKSQFSGNHFHHIVLGVHSGGRFGALGMSRREDLMFKPLEFRTLLDLVQEFEGAYRGYWHTLRKVKIGQYVSHDPHSVEQIEWKHSILDVDKLTKEELRKELERHTRDMRLKVEWRGSWDKYRVLHIDSFALKCLTC